MLELNEVVISLSGKGGGSGKVFYGYVGFFFHRKMRPWNCKSLVASLSTWSQGVHLISSGRGGSMWSYQFFTTQRIGMAT